MPVQNVICLVIDRLRAAALGTYGAAFCETPELDSLASEALVLDQALVTAIELEPTYARYWLTGPAAPGGDAGAALPALLSQAGLHTSLLTDDPRIARLPAADMFSERLLVPPSEPSQPADDLAETGLAHYFAQAIDTLERLASNPQQPFCLWLHSRGLAAPWDAPYRFRQELSEEDDPDPPHFCEVPGCRLSEDYDPDQLLGIVQAYSGQVRALDRCLSALLEHLRGGRLEQNTLVILTAPRGFALGEHLAVGDAGDRLLEEVVHVPLLVRFPDHRGALCRSPALVEPRDLPATVLDWLGIALPSGPPALHSLLLLVDREQQTPWRQAVWMEHRNERAIRTPAWHLRICTEGADGQRQLYVKPDDRWEANEVSARCADITTQLAEALSALERAQRNNEPPPPLDAALLERLE